MAGSITEVSSIAISKSITLRVVAYVPASTEKLTMISSPTEYWVLDEVAEKVAYYFGHYPFNKFITKAQVQDICKKYGLVFGKTEWYVGDIPEKNQLEIADFQVRDQDKTGNRDIMIVATKDEFDTKGLNLSDGWELKELPKDPIVLYPVFGGYLIVSKWGVEADIDEVQ